MQWLPVAVSPGVKRPGREADHSPAASAEVKKMWIYTSTPPYVFTGTTLPYLTLRPVITNYICLLLLWLFKPVTYFLLVSVHFTPCQPWLRMRGKLQRVDSVVTPLARRCRTRVPAIDKVKRLIRLGIPLCREKVPQAICGVVLFLSGDSCCPVLCWRYALRLRSSVAVFTYTSYRR
jgi:hypothetical protein